MSPENILDTILAEKRREIAVEAAAVPLSELQQLVERSGACIGFARALRAASGTPVIAEVKRASPSKGPIRPDLDPVETAKDFAASGASCLSILTDKKFFQGDLEFLKKIRQAVPTLPLLRKDFICHPYQVWQSRAAGADALLLIVAALQDSDLELLAAEGRKAELDVMIEVHTLEELQRAVRLLERRFPKDDSFLIGINSRDLKTFRVDLSIAERLIAWLNRDSKFIPPLPIVAESGISRGEDINLLRGYGAGAFLVGEALVAKGSPGENLRRLIADSAEEMSAEKANG